MNKEPTQLMTNTLTSPFQAPVPPAPRLAHLEVLERHRLTGPMAQDRPLIPNVVRVNGRELHACQDDPVVVHEIRIAGDGSFPVVVTLRFLARAVAFGARTPEDSHGPADSCGRSFPVIEVPELPDENGFAVTRYVLIDGMAIRTGGDIVIHEVPLGDTMRGQALVVDVPLLCRSVRFDDDPAPARE